MKEALLDFYTSSGKGKPDQIIIFMDRVSESQFNQVLIKLLRLASSLNHPLGWNDSVSLAGIFRPEVHWLKGRTATY